MSSPIRAPPASALMKSQKSQLLLAGVPQGPVCCIGACFCQGSKLCFSPNAVQIYF